MCVSSNISEWQYIICKVLNLCVVFTDTILQDAQSAINDLTGMFFCVCNCVFLSAFAYIYIYCCCSYPFFSGKWLGSRQIRCNWAAKGAGSTDDKQSSDNHNMVVLTGGISGRISMRSISLLLEISANELCRFFHLFFCNCSVG